MPDHPLKPLLIGGMGVGVIRRKSLGGVPYGEGAETSFSIGVINFLKEKPLSYKSLTYKDLKSYPQGLDSYSLIPYFCTLIIHPKGTTFMTIQEFVLSQPTMGINGWLKAIEIAGLQKYQHTIIECACHFDRITVNHSATFGKQSINI